MLLAALAAALCVPAAGVSSGSGLPTTIGKGEGQLNLVAWEGYTQPQWVKPFEQKTGCQVHAKYAGSSDEMVTLMRQGGGSQYDMVSASGDASLRLIYGKDVQPVNVNLIPDWKNFIPQLKSPPHNTIKGVHYGVSLQWGPNTLLYNTQKVKPSPTSWASIYSPAFKGKVTVPDNPIQIADAALYLSKSKPSLGITDPYELNQTQFNAAIDLLKQQKPLIKKYWALASDEVDLFKNGGVVIGASWPLQTITLQNAKAPVKDLIPKEGATGWADTWMLSAHAKHPNCAYKWLQWISTPKVQAEQALSFEETPANAKACSFMDKLQAGSCAAYHLNAPASYFNSIKFWKTPVAACGNGKNDCMDYTKWQQAWTQLRDSWLLRPRTGAGRAAQPGRPGCAFPGSSGSTAGRRRCCCSHRRCCVRTRLSRLARSPLRLVVLDGQPVHDGDRAHLERRQLPDALGVERLPLDRIADDRDRRRRHCRRRAARLPARLLHGPGRRRPLARVPVRRGALAALVELPRQGLHRRLILNQDGVLNWTLGKVGIGPLGIGFTNWSVWLIFTYVWLPFMILPVYGALERIPESYIEASRDLGGSGFRTFRSVVCRLRSRE